MNNNNFNYKKQLPEVFKELQEMQRQNIYQEMNRKRVYEYNQPKINHKFNAIGAIIGILFLILFLTTIKSNYIFATTPEDEIDSSAWTTIWIIIGAFALQIIIVMLIVYAVVTLP